MAASLLNNVVHQVRSLAGTPAAAESDGELLSAFVRRQDQAAFALLVRRHGPLVLRVCRRVAGHEQDAEDAFQATFLVLARKAAAIRKRAALASWLYGAAYRMAQQARRSAARRRDHERRAAVATPPDPAAELTWHEVQTALDEEIARLPEKYRAVFLVCCVECLSRAEAAAVLALKEGTVCSRLAKARRLLQGRLARRGIQLSAVLAAAALAHAPAVVPASLAAGTIRAAGWAAAGGPLTAELVSASVIALTNAGVRALVPVPWKSVLAVLLTLGLVAGGVGLAVQIPSPTQPVDEAPAKNASATPQRLPARTDLHGDPLPPAATARLGTVGLRHGSAVTGVAFTPDGKTLISASYDKTVRQWDAVTGRELHRLPPTNGSVMKLAVAGDGNTLAALDMWTIHLGDLKAGTLAPAAFLPNRTYTGVALSRDGKSLAAAADQTVTVWDLPARRQLHTFAGHQADVRHAAFSPDGKYLATGDQAGSIRLWDVAGGKEVRQFRAGAVVHSLAFSGDGQLLAAGGGDKTLFLWEVQGGKLIHHSAEQGLPVESVAFSPDGRLVATGVNGLVTLWSVATKKQVRRLWDSHGTAIAFSPDGRTLAAGGHNSTIRLRDVATGKDVTPAAGGHQARVTTLAAARDGSVVVTGGGDRVIRVWDPRTGKELRALDAHSTWFIGKMALSADGRCVATEGRVWEMATGKVIGKIPGHDYSAAALAFAPDGRQVALGTTDLGSAKGRTIRLWDVPAMRERPGFGTLPIHSLAYAPDGKTLAAGNGDGSVSLWEPAAGRERAHLQGHPREVRTVAFAPDGRLLASATYAGDICLWDTADGRLVRALGNSGPGPGWQGNVLAVAFAPNGKMLASAEQPFTSEAGESITVWETATGRVRMRLKGHAGDVDCLAFAGDSRTLVSGSNDTTGLVWDLLRAVPGRSGTPAALWEDLLSPDAARAFPAAVALARSPDGLRLLGERLAAAPPPDAQHFARLVRQLDSVTFAERDQAQKELERLGEAAEPALREALTATQSAEVRRRLKQVRERLDGEWLRMQRAVEALELSATAEARQVLELLAKGLPGARVTAEARAALARVRR